MGLAAKVVYDLKIKERRGYLFKNQKKLMKNVQIWYEYGTKIVPKLGFIQFLISYLLN